MRNMNRAGRSLILAAFVAVMIGPYAVLAQISGATKGQPVTATGGTTATSDGSSWDAARFAGSDICAQINAAWSAAITAGATGATIDARGVTGAQSCGGSPFPSGASGVLLLGNAQIVTTVPWQIPSRVHVQGIGVSPLSDTGTNFHNTEIKAGTGVTGAVVQLGNGSGSGNYDVQLRSLTVDAAGIASTGVLNDSAEEGSVVEDVNIYNASGYGLLIQANSTSAPVNSGPYRNINIQYNSECTSSCNSTNTIGIGVVASSEQSAAIRGIDNVTVSGGGITGGTQALYTCIDVVGFPVRITNSHVEYCVTGIQIGSPGGGGGIPETNNVEVQNVSTNPYHGWNIVIGTAQDVLLSGISAWGTDVLEDNSTLNQITGTANAVYYLGYYLLGDIATGSSTPAVISTSATVTSGPHSPNLEWVAPGGLDVLSALQKPSGSFKIDHPLDPANKYLYHSFVESPDMMDVYNGSVTTDKSGMATVNMPDYFDSLNRDFRYQLTAIGTFAQATVAKEILNNQFVIRTSKPGVKVSWQVTGIRQDAYANAHRIQVEEEKPPRERGHYLHPELFQNKGGQVASEAPTGK
jgi:hypothetical protein